ncbi:hypothetical protein BGZ58_011115 [Dissophora ornata]|nr:hypothetical protein BGZ58_011115 [Dissophora ornata]
MVSRHNNINSTASTSAAQVCDGCVQEESDEDDYNDSEYVDDEVTSLLNNAFLQIGKTPNSRMDDTPHMQNHHNSRSGGSAYDDDDDQSIEVVITDQKDKILRRALDNTSDLDMDFHGDDDDDDDHHEDDQHQGGLLKSRENSWSSVSTRSQKPFAPASKRRKSGNAPKIKGRKHNKDCPMDPANDKKDGTNKQLGDRPLLGSGINTMSTYGATPSSTDRNYTTPSLGHSRSEQATHLRRTSFPRLKGSGTFYSRHDSLDHAVADDREHADLTEIGIQTALTIAVHKFPDPCLGLSVFMAISVHNIIEGYLIAFPLFVGLHSRAKAFALAAALGGLSQPLGAVMGWFILRKVASMGWQVSATGCIYAMVAGMMSSIAVNGMWPQAVKCVGRNPTKVVQYSFFAGIAIMGICQAVMGKKCDF